MAIAWPLLLALTSGSAVPPQDVTAPPPASEAGDPAEFEYEPEPPMLFNRLSSPWLSLSFGAGVTFMPFWDMSIRPRIAVGFLWDAIELGGKVILGTNGLQVWAGGGMFLNWTPVPYRAGQIFYTQIGLGRLHTKDQFFGKRHVDFMQFGIGFRIARRPLERLYVPFIEVGYDYRQRCGDWATPCSFDDRAWWMPWFEAGFRFR